jgi:hypothetical protein
MKTKTFNIAFPVEFRIVETKQWLGRTDRVGRNIMESTYAAKAFLFDREIAASDYGLIFRTEAGALRNCRAWVRSLIKSQGDTE